MAVALYRDVWPRLPGYHIVLIELVPVPDQATADDILSGRYGPVAPGTLWIKTNEICMDFFMEQREAVLPIMVEEIREFQEASCTALHVLFELHRHAYLRGGVWNKDGSVSLSEEIRPAWEAFVEALYPIISRCFRECGTADRDRAFMLAQGLRDLGDPRAIGLLLGEDAERGIVRYFEFIRTLQRRRTANAQLLTLLSSGDAGVRWRAAYALAESGDAGVVEPVLKLLRDRDARVRAQALWIASQLPADAKERTWAAGVPLLGDQDLDVRITCVTCFAYEKDPICAPALLRLLKDETLGEVTHGNLVRAMESLAGQSFGYHIGSDAWQPSTENNKAAIAKFEEWMRQHPPASS